MEHCRLAGITCMALVSDKEGNYVKVNRCFISFFYLTDCRVFYASAYGNGILCPQVKSFERDRQSEKRIQESDLVDHIIQKCRTKFFDDRNVR